jgi:hypothetical protein
MIVRFIPYLFPSRRRGMGRTGVNLAQAFHKGAGYECSWGPRTKPWQAQWLSREKRAARSLGALIQLASDDRGLILVPGQRPPRGTFAAFVFGRKGQPKIRALFGWTIFTYFNSYNHSKLFPLVLIAPRSPTVDVAPRQFHLARAPRRGSWTRPQ